MQSSNEYLELTFESDSGTGNGVAVSFDTTLPMKSEKVLWVTVDGLNYTLNEHYSVSLVLNRITFVVAPAIGQKINIKYARK